MACPIPYVGHNNIYIKNKIVDCHLSPETMAKFDTECIKTMYTCSNIDQRLMPFLYTKISTLCPK